MVTTGDNLRWRLSPGQLSRMGKVTREGHPGRSVGLSPDQLLWNQEDVDGVELVGGVNPRLARSAVAMSCPCSSHG